VNRRPVSPLILRGLEIAEKHFGIDELCARLATTPATVQAWRTGHEEMPDALFLKLVDLLIELDPGGIFPKPRP
jgi:hypothetical protein